MERAMARFKIRVAASDTNDLGQYDLLAAAAKRAGFHAMSCGSIAELTDDQMADREDSWVRFTAGNAGVTKFVETEVVNGVISKAHIEKNATLLREKSKILARHGLKGYIHMLEPQWLPESFYAKHPELRGARCDHPGVARSKYYSPCLDRPEILAHYKEAARRLAELAPELGIFGIWTNDSGGGICWCTGLYSGQNGPEHCKDTPLEMRLRRWFEAIIAGGKDAGREMEVFFNPVHFSPKEIQETLEKLPRRARFILHQGANPNEPFVYETSRALIAESKKARRPAALGVDPTLGYPLGPLTEPPIPFFIFDVMSEASRSGAEAVITGGVKVSTDEVDVMTTMAVTDSLAKPPRSAVDIERAVLKIAKAQVGEKSARALYDAWKDVDHAFRIWPLMNDGEHMLYTYYTIQGMRWIVRPIVPVPERVPREERQYYLAYVHGGRDPRHEHEWFVSESRKVYGLDEYKWVVNTYDVMLMYMGRALKTLEGAIAAAAEGPEKARLARHYRRIAILAGVWRTHRNVFSCGSIIEYMKSDRKAEFEKRAPTLKRFFITGVNDEIQNCREMVKTLRESDVVLIGTGEKESSFVLPKNLDKQIEMKIALMEKYRGDIDLLFPNCPEECVKDETYEDTDKKLEAEGV
jgi:hypothetical protein